LQFESEGVHVAHESALTVPNIGNRFAQAFHAPVKYWPVRRLVDLIAASRPSVRNSLH